MPKFDRVEIVRAKNGYILHAYEEDSLLVEDYVVADACYCGDRDKMGRLIEQLLSPQEEV